MSRLETETETGLHDYNNFWITLVPSHIDNFMAIPNPTYKSGWHLCQVISDFMAIPNSIYISG